MLCPLYYALVETHWLGQYQISSFTESINLVSALIYHSVCCCDDFWSNCIFHKARSKRLHSFVKLWYKCEPNENSLNTICKTSLKGFFRLWVRWSNKHRSWLFEGSFAPIICLSKYTGILIEIISIFNLYLYLIYIKMRKHTTWLKIVEYRQNRGIDATPQVCVCRCRQPFDYRYRAGFFRQPWRWVFKEWH